MTEKAKGKAPADWERIELDYRAGVKSLREIASEHGITEGAIRKRAKKPGEEWVRDLAGKIQAKAEELVRKDAVRSEVRANQAASEKVVVEANAQAIADVRLAHRKDILRARVLTNALLDELAQQTDPDTLALLSDLGELMCKPDEKTGRDRLNELYHAVIALPERAKTMKTLAESLQKLVDMERTAFGMDAKDKAPGTDPLALAVAEFTPARAASALQALEELRRRRESAAGA
ncbi:hypothetical protein [Acidovorax sp. Root219]|uniref:hypothetical protein n=1 Tax=Acidovorax sp. Root219 TaxID=1736493 RepID=UPI000AA294AB|nr:hypothetical protein [Acidovorax sp. Root219]